MICQSCGCDAPTQSVGLHQNIGVLIMRFYEGIEGNLCKNCISSYFWRYTGVNLLLGWWGLISLIITPFFIINNTYYYINSLGLEPPREGSGPPTLTEQDAQRLTPYVEQIVSRFNAGENLEQVCGAISQQAGVSPGKVFLFIKVLSDSEG